MVITKRLRGTWHAWHFQFALSLVVKVLCGHFCIACQRPLTRRYTPYEESLKIQVKNRDFQR
ncbi:hypothetical protein BBM19_23465 [Vibrio parahaemolyticus]|nr:DUF3265 domain-containing protein [Vibrio parahaemolyticus]EJE4701657.1 DUF3265 domain-containing protein [Vibrio parahaemolyticus]ELA9558562.1 DUF3265 domain-containing protein [Vibrio parahaemolyticus]OMP47694.1 hypothetical protein BBM19_23465 [Vibrio parahaemolyticus]TXM29664.1 DUF3265 domain-containing protein [Vibrio parahaemolyticus]